MLNKEKFKKFNKKVFKYQFHYSTSFNVLTLYFINLKSTERITWDWIWVISPTCIPLILLSISFIYFFIYYYIFSNHIEK